MKNFLVTVKNRLGAGWQLFIQAVSENERKSLTIAASLVIFSIIFSVSVGYAQKSVRKDELNTLVNQQMQSDYITPLLMKKVMQLLRAAQQFLLCLLNLMEIF